MADRIKLPTLLVFSENPALFTWVKKNLEERFFLIHTDRPEEVFAALNARLDAVIIDGVLDEVQALKICRELIKKRRNSEIIPVLLITGRLKKDFRERAHKQGVADFLSPQWDDEELKAKIDWVEKINATRDKTQNLTHKNFLKPS